jgi:hypothetical protein
MAAAAAAVPATAALVPTGATARWPRRAEASKQGQSSKPNDTLLKLNATQPEFALKLQGLRQLAPWGIFSCAEPNALANLLETHRDADMAEIEITRTEREGEILPLCKNCAQWLQETSTRSQRYTIKPEFLDPKPKKAEYRGGFGMEEFPPLGGK